MRPGGFRIDLSTVPSPILLMFSEAHQTLRRNWTLPIRLLEIIRLYSAFEHDCHT